MQFTPDVPLAPYTTLRIGGPARWFAEALTEEDISAGSAFAEERGLPLFVLGGGSNLLVSDRGFPGLVLRIALPGIHQSREGVRTVFSVAAGEPWDAFVAGTVDGNCAGVECLSGIPGAVGGTPIQNVGAYGQEVSKTIVAVRALDRATSRFVTIANAECGFEYRRSIFNSTFRDRYIVSRVDFALADDGAATVAYADLKRRFSHRERNPPSLAEVRRAVLAIRADKGMVLVPGDRDSLSAGSFFKNPVAPAAVRERLAQALGLNAEEVPGYPTSDGEWKLSAAWLLEQAGFHRGYALGRAGISSRHTLALINRGGAAAADMIALRDKIVGAVQSRLGIVLEPEPIWVGAPDRPDPASGE